MSHVTCVTRHTCHTTHVSHDKSPEPPVQGQAHVLTHSRSYLQQIFIERIPCFKNCPWNRIHIKSVGSLCVQPQDCRWQYTNPMTVPRVTKACPCPRKRLPCPGRAHCQNTTMIHSLRSGKVGRGAGGTHHFRGCGISLLSCHVSTESFSLFGLKLGKDKSLLRSLPNPPHRAPRAREKEGAPA